jgi:pyruvate formate lyase activating enzyme
MSVTGKIHSVETLAALDGPGLRYALFLQGCKMRCLYCHNPDSWSTLRGKEISVDSVIQDVLSYTSFLKNGGLTISGGEPLLQPEFTLSLIKEAKRNNIHTALDTAGSVSLELSKEILDKVDMVLLDIKSVEKEQHIRLTCQSNDNTLATLDYLESIHKRVWIRHVLVPQITQDDSLVHKLGKFLSSYSCIESVDLLPFHQLGSYKYKELGIPYALKGTSETSQSELLHFQIILESYGLEVTRDQKVS